MVAGASPGANRAGPGHKAGRAWQSGLVPAPYKFAWRDFPPRKVAEAKAASSSRVSVCIPARDEEATVGDIVAQVHGQLVERHHVVDELLVVDDGSADATAKEAEQAGAEVVSLPSPRGKGAAMRAGLAATSGDIVAYCDADVTDFTSRFVLGLVGPLLCHPEVVFVKGAYRRPVEGPEGVVQQGGRVTELVAKPLLGLLFPEVPPFGQPLAGETAARRAVLESVGFEEGYGVELGLLIDVARRYGAAAMAECDLGERRHRNRSLAELVPQAETVIRVALARASLPRPR
jgi:glucosyl-3-phosphoglycerate synthase